MTWQILPEQLSPDVYVSNEYGEAPDVGRSKATIDLFGRGISRPLRRSKNNDFESTAGADLIRCSVGLVLGTVCASQSSHGELPWRTEFGSLLQLLRLRNLDAAIEGLAKYYIADALARWIPAVRIRQVKFLKGRKETLWMHVIYDVVDPAGTQVLVPGLQTKVPFG